MISKMHIGERKIYNFLIGISFCKLKFREVENGVCQFNQLLNDLHIHIAFLLLSAEYGHTRTRSY